MRRTQALQIALPLPLEADVSLADMRCEACGVLGAAVVALGANGSGAIERTWCGPDCARTAGWPWLVGERASKSARTKAEPQPIGECGG